MFDWYSYFYQEFPDELRSYLGKNRPKNNCPHTQAPLERQCLIDKKDFYHRYPEKFRFCWYGITLSEQGLFRYFPGSYRKWIRHTGGYPLPMHNIGFGCVRVSPPHRLLCIADSFTGWGDYISFWFEEIDDNFNDVSGLEPSEFFPEIIEDQQFGQKENDLESFLKEQIKLKYG